MTTSQAVPATRFAIVGAGPAGFYAAEALLRAGHAVDLYDRLPAPYGLVRYGVAPDHPKLKQVIAVFERIASLPGFRFVGNVQVDRDVTVRTLRLHYRAVMVCCGAERDRALGIPGEGLAGVHGGMAFVGWYNGHPDRAALDPDLTGRHAIVIGMGNVALDVARILSKPAAALATTDIAAHALAALSASGIGRVTVAARGGPEQARCTEKELREFRSLDGCGVTADDAGYAAAPSGIVPGIFAALATASSASGRRCHFAFGLRPQEIVGEAGRVRAVRFTRGTVTNGQAAAGNDIVDLPADLVITCVGSCATAIAGLIAAPGGNGVRHMAGRALDADGIVIPGLYVSGWIKRGASGTIGTNRADAVETVASLLADLPDLPVPIASPDSLIGPGSVMARHIVSFDQWKIIDRIEITRGLDHARPREKIININKMLEEIQVGF